LDPTIIFSPVNEVVIDNDDITIVTSNVSSGPTSSFSMAISLVDQALQTRYGSRNGNAFLFPPPILIAAPVQTSKWAYAAITITSNEAIADLGATQIFVMDGTPVHNKQQMMCPCKAALADGRQVMSTHMCDIIREEVVAKQFTHGQSLLTNYGRMVLVCYK
jgi:hypothetical protein